MVQLVQAVRHPKGCEWSLGAVAELLHCCQHGGLAGWIQKSSGFVEQQQIGVAG